jgi:adenylate cyclase
VTGGKGVLKPSILLALIVGLLLAPLSWVQAFNLMEARAYDLMSTLWPPRPESPGAVIVAIDQSSFAEWKQQWPWPRSIHGKLIESLRSAGAKLIAFDVIFADPSADPRQDRQLAEKIRPDIVLAGEVTVDETPQAVQTIRVEPLPEFVARGAHAGIASVGLDGDSVLRTVPSAPDAFARVIAKLNGHDAGDFEAKQLIQYFGPPGAYPRVSYYQALDPQSYLPAGFFKDRIVIVGLNLQNAADADSRQPDTFATSYTAKTGLLMAGPEVQATLLDNIMHDLSVRPGSPWLTALATFATVFLMSFLTQRAHPWRAAITLVSGSAVLIGGSYLALRFGRFWLPPVLPLAGSVIAAAAETGRSYLMERAARRRIMEAFAHYLAPSLVEQLARDPSRLKLGGERRVLTVLFCDVRGFTTISEKLRGDPERLTSLVNRMLTHLSQAVFQTGGTIDKYIGDCVMAFWNAPLEDRDHALHAVEAAKLMQESIKELNVELSTEAKVEDAPPINLTIGIGINTGECVVGNMGSEQRFDYTAVGDTVNLASRLEGLCKVYDTGIILGEATAKALEGRVATRKVDDAYVAGKSEKVSVYTLA